MKIAFVTFTGPDNKTDVADLAKFSADYPSDSLEWGILLSKSSEGGPRFPTYRWMQDFYQESGGLVTCAGHLCGRYARDLIAGEFTFRRERRSIMPLFQRFQVNFHGEPFGDNAPLLNAVKLFGNEAAFIIQMDDVNDFRFHEASAASLRVVPLFDRSHGEGVVPESWPVPVAPFCGYAGGLGPDNLADELKRIEDVVGDGCIWIDMETRVRNDDDHFDLGLVARCMDQALPYLE